MTLKSLIQSDVANVFLNTTEFADAVTFEQGAASPIATTGIRRTDVKEQLETEGFGTASVNAEWLIPVAYLGSVEPREGDRIAVTGTNDVYEVMPTDAARASVLKDDSGHLWVIQTKQVGG